MIALLALVILIGCLISSSNTKKSMAADHPPRKCLEELCLTYEYYLDYIKKENQHLHDNPERDATIDAKLNIFKQGYSPYCQSHWLSMSAIREDIDKAKRDFARQETISGMWDYIERQALETHTNCGYWYGDLPEEYDSEYIVLKKFFEKYFFNYEINKEEQKIIKTGNIYMAKQLDEGDFGLKHKEFMIKDHGMLLPDENAWNRYCNPFLERCEQAADQFCILGLERIRKFRENWNLNDSECETIDQRSEKINWYNENKEYLQHNRNLTTQEKKESELENDLELFKFQKFDEQLERIDLHPSVLRYSRERKSQL